VARPGPRRRRAPLAGAGAREASVPHGTARWLFAALLRLLGSERHGRVTHARAGPSEPPLRGTTDAS